MTKGNGRLFWVWMFALSFCTAGAQSAQQIIQRAVDNERAADQNDHYNWIYLEESDKPKEHILQWVAGTQHGNVERVLEKDDQQFAEARQRELIEKYLHDTRAQNKQVAEANHDNKQIDDLLKLLPVAFLWDTDRVDRIHDVAALRTGAKLSSADTRGAGFQRYDGGPGRR